MPSTSDVTRQHVGHCPEGWLLSHSRKGFPSLLPCGDVVDFCYLFSSSRCRKLRALDFEACLHMEVLRSLWLSEVLFRLFPLHYDIGSSELCLGFQDRPWLSQIKGSVCFSDPVWPQSVWLSLGVQQQVRGSRDQLLKYPGWHVLGNTFLKTLLGDNLYSVNVDFVKCAVW